MYQKLKNHKYMYPWIREWIIHQYLKICFMCQDLVHKENVGSKISPIYQL